MSTAPPPRRRPIGRIVVAMLFVVLAMNAGNEALEMLRGTSDGPTTLLVLQSLCAASGAAAAWGAWRGARWSAALAVLYGAIASSMVVALGPLLDMPVEGRGGLRIGGAIVLAVSLGCAWYLRRVGRAIVEPPVHTETRGV